MVVLGIWDRLPYNKTFVVCRSALSSAILRCISIFTSAGVRGKRRLYSAVPGGVYNDVRWCHE